MLHEAVGGLGGAIYGGLESTEELQIWGFVSRERQGRERMKLLRRCIHTYSNQLNVELVNGHGQVVEVIVKTADLEGGPRGALCHAQQGSRVESIFVLDDFGGKVDSDLKYGFEQGSHVLRLEETHFILDDDLEGLIPAAACTCAGSDLTLILRFRAVACFGDGEWTVLLARAILFDLVARLALQLQDGVL